MSLFQDKQVIQTTLEATVNLGIVWDWSSDRPTNQNPNVGRVDLVRVDNTPGAKTLTWSAMIGLWRETWEDLTLAQYGALEAILVRFDPMIPVCSNGGALGVSSFQVGLPNKSAQRSGISDFTGLWSVMAIDVTLQRR